MSSKSYSDLSVATNKPTLDEPAAFPNIAAIVDRVQQRCALGYFPLRGRGHPGGVGSQKRWWTGGLVGKDVRSEERK